jgi:predicted secreted protein
MGDLSFWSAAEDAIKEIVTSLFIFLPAFISCLFYGAYLQTSNTITLPRKERKRKAALHLIIAICVLIVVVYGFGQRCSTDEFGDCADYDWSAPSSQDNLKNMIRLTVLVIAGMALAYFRAPWRNSVKHTDQYEK